MTDHVVRAALAGDAGDVARIWCQGWHDAHDGFVSPELVAARADHTFLTRANERWPDTLVGVGGNTIAGFVMVNANEVEQLYVAGDRRGTGVAAALLAAAEDLLSSRGFRQAWLAVIPENVRARRFYDRCGWRDEGTFVYDAEFDGEQIGVPCRRYAKMLDGTA
ncbi:GNAT family N-acetyltransferase [Nakamurella lactea]|uniref:GNAT family N-acetyltransferase n=1 Tax=Nakamurella lactea TaxID=459515 RepID=UPI000417F34D|nr:GNAT family N-acetyltransferase [Nakamurella lactea]